MQVDTEMFKGTIGKLHTAAHKSEMERGPEQSSSINTQGS